MGREKWENREVLIWSREEVKQKWAQEVGIKMTNIFLSYGE